MKEVDIIKNMVDKKKVSCYRIAKMFDRPISPSTVTRWIKKETRPTKMYLEELRLIIKQLEK